MVLATKLAPNGLKFAVGEVPGLVPLTWSDSPTEKQVHEVYASFELHEGSYKYEPELIVSAWSNRFPKVMPRRSNYFRVELVVPLQLFFSLQVELLPACYARLASK